MELAGGRVETERDVGDAERGLHRRIAAFELADALYGLETVAPRLLGAGGEGERQAVDEDVLNGHPPVADEVVDDPTGDPDLVLSRAGLALLVDAHHHDGSAVLANDVHLLDEVALRAVAVLVVHRVHDAAPAETLQAGLDDLPLGGVDHQRQRRSGCEPCCRLAHVESPIASDVVDAHVQHVRAVTNLVAGDLDTVVPSAFEHRLPKRLGTVGVGALADRQIRDVLPERHVLVERGGTRLRARLARLDLPTPYPFDDGADVIGGGATTAADQRPPAPAPGPGA